jgi:hypothetical protein
MRISNFFLIVLATSIVACNNKTIKVSTLQNTTNLANGIVYSLPQTVISIKVDVSKKVVIPGPYADYAQKYLGIANAPTKEFEGYSISSISIGSFSETDPNALYTADLNGKSLFDFFKMTNAGIVIPVGDFKTLTTTNNDILKDNQININYSDLSIDPFIAEEKTTFYSKVQRDSSFVRVPVQKSMIIQKNTEEKAKEASDFIFSLRKKRLEFMTIDVDHPLDGEALKAMFAEISRLENEYLSLFIGKSYTETISKTILYTPSKPEGESSIAFRYSTSKGVVSANDLSGNPILIEIEPEPIPESYNTFFNSVTVNSEKNKFDMVYYRIPVNALVKFTDGKNELSDRTTSHFSSMVQRQNCQLSTF